MNIGVVGCGRIADAHLMIYRFIKGAKVKAVTDINIENAKKLAVKYKIEKTFNDYCDLLEINDLDFVDICTPPSTHVEIACKAAEHGHNILLEKPMALSTKECEKIIHAAEKKSVNLCVCHNQLFFPAIMKAKAFVDSGHYEIVSFRTSVRENPEMFNVPKWNLTEKEKGLIWEVGCHPAYLHLHFLGDIKEVYAVGSKVKYPVFDEFTVILRTSGKAFGLMEISWLSRGTEKIYEINCSNGKRAFMIAPPPYANQGYDVLLEKTGIAESDFYSEIKKLLGHLVKRGTFFGYYTGHFNLIKRYIQSLKGSFEPPVKLKDAVNTIRLLECIEASLKIRKIVKLNLPS
jgi:UDP-N-acetylglucosamine 3-dehydrogenase